MTTIPDLTSLKKLKLAELTELCKKHSIPSSGKKDDLIARLSALQTDTADNKDQKDDENSDKIDQFDWDHDDLAEYDSELATKATDSKPQDDKTANPISESQSTTTKTETSTLLSSNSKAMPDEGKTAQSGSENTNQTNDSSKTCIRTLGVIQVSLSEEKPNLADPDNRKAQLALEEEKRKLRAQRFGTVDTTKRPSSSQLAPESPNKVSKLEKVLSAVTSEDPDILKKRAEKFGAKSAPVTVPKKSKIINLSLTNNSKTTSE